MENKKPHARRPLTGLTGLTTVGLLAILLTASNAAQASLIDIFGMAQNPTSGELLLRRGITPEKIPFGATTGLYGVGFRLTPELLPEPYRTQFAGQTVIQVLLGNSTPGEKVSQFGTLLLVHEPFTQSSRLVVPGNTKSAEKNAVYVQINSPANLANASDEDRLKSTFFATQGFATITPKGKAEVVTISFADKRLRFLKNRLKLELNALLATPFNPQSADIKGVIEIALFAPGAEDTKIFLKSVLAETLHSPVSGATH